MPDLAKDKIKLRQQLRAARRALTRAQQQTAAAALQHSVQRLPNWQAAQTIALYAPADGEIGTAPLEQLARSAGKHVLLPIITQNKTLEFARWDRDAQLGSNRYNIAEPDAMAQRSAAHEIDIVFLPVVGWDNSGARLGMGGGFYDRTFQRMGETRVTQPTLVGLAHSCQELRQVPVEPFDVLLDFVATDNALIECQRRS